MKDRVVQYPNRYKLTPVSGDIYNLTPEPGVVTEEGTNISKATLLRDQTAELLGLSGDPTVDEALGRFTTLMSRTARFVIGTSTAGWTAADCDYLCDGTADQVEINAAIQALPAAGGEIVILDGTYNIIAEILINKSNVSIRGNGNAAVLKRMFDGDSASGVIGLRGVEKCKISDLQVDGNGDVYTASSNHGIYLHSSNNNTIISNTCNDAASGIRIEFSDDNTITANTCSGNFTGIEIRDSSGNVIAGNACSNNSGQNGISVFRSNKHIITGNICKGNYIGVNVNSSNENTVAGNTLDGNAGNGVSFNLANNNTIAGNACTNNNVGIGLTGNSSNNSIVGNACIRGAGQAADYTAGQYTIRLMYATNNYNLLSSNHCMGKAPTIEGGTSNTNVNNKHQ